MIITEKETLAKISDLEQEGYTWKPLGNNLNNEGIIQILTDPVSGLAERITNAIDAVLQKYYFTLKSLAKNPNELGQEVREKINDDDFNEMIRVLIYDSKSKKQDKSISIVIEDKGIGVSGNDFEKTILKIGGDNKLTKKYLMGAYGQGGSTSVKFNEYTIIYSKSKDSKEVMTIIRYNIGTEETKNGTYEYIVKNDNGKSQFASSSNLKEVGTKIVNVATYFKKGLNLTNQFNLISKLLTNRLFYPPLPFTLIDERPNKLLKPHKLIKGARKKLEQDIRNSEHFGYQKIKTNEGSSIKLRWWVVMPRKNERLQNLVDSYLKDPRQPFNFTINGQTQGYYSSNFLDEVELSFLKKRFVCEIDLTGISKGERRSIFSSSREKISKDSYFWEEIKAKITKYFLECQKIQDINNKIKEMMTSAQHNDKNFNKELSKALKSIVSSSPKGHLKPLKENNLIDQEEKVTNKKVEEPLKIFPSYFNFKGIQPIEFIGNNLKLYYETDGMPRIILKKIKVPSIPSCLELISKKQNGKNGVITFDAKKAPLNENLKITFDVLNGSFVKDVFVRKTNPLEKPKKPGYPQTNIVFVSKVGEYNYKLHDFNEKKPCSAEYSKITNKLSIYINFANYTLISKYSRNQKMIDQFRIHYSMGLSIYIISRIRKYESENSEIEEDYDYNPIAKNLIWTFDKIQKIR